MINKLSIHQGGQMGRRKDIFNKLPIHPAGGDIKRREDMINKLPIHPGSNGKERGCD